jgi:hypothetical protein
MPRLDLVCQAVHDPAFLAQGPEALDVQADVAPTAAGLREVQDDAPDAAENGLAAIGRAPLDLHHWLPRRGQPLGIPPIHQLVRADPQKPLQRGPHRAGEIESDAPYTGNVSDSAFSFKPRIRLFQPATIRPR